MPACAPLAQENFFLYHSRPDKRHGNDRSKAWMYVGSDGFLCDVRFSFSVFELT